MSHVNVMRGDRIVLHDFSLCVEAGEHVAILGPNGCGKSTLIKTLMREFYPLARDGTRMALFGRETWHVFDLRSLLGLVSNDLTAACTRDVKGFEVVLSGFFSSIGVWPYHEVTTAMREKAAEVMDLLEITHLSDRWLDELSSGEARRLVIARALVHDPKALLLDEPSNSLDLHAQFELRKIVRKLAASGLTLLLVTHHLDDIIPEIERVILIREGRIFADGPKRAILTEQNLSAVFGLDVQLVEREGQFHFW